MGRMEYRNFSGTLVRFFPEDCSFSFSLLQVHANDGSTICTSWVSMIEPIMFFTFEEEDNLRIGLPNLVYRD